MNRMMSAVAVTALLASGCAVRSTNPEGAAAAQPDLAESRNPRLYEMLSSYPLTDAHRDSLEAYAVEYTSLTESLLAEAATDSAAPATVRANALHVLARRRAELQLPVFRAALDDPDPRVRATAVASMREFMGVRPLDALQLARRGLRDADSQVQAQSLAIIGPRDVPLLRDYITRAGDEELRRIASDLVSTAEERGAPLAGDSMTGRLSRVTGHGHRIEFAPQRHWPAWDAALGTVTITAHGRTFSVDSVEAVRDVVPLFVSPDGTHAVYERARRIHVVDLRTGAVEDVGPGIAPRVRPFTNEFVYFRELEDRRHEVRERTQLLYDVVTGTFEDGEAAGSLGTLNASVTHAVAGSFSPVRWVVVEERAGAYYLTADEAQSFPLPDPFSGIRGDQ